MKKARIIIVALLLFAAGTMTQAQDYSFDRGCRVVSADGTTQFQLLNILADLPAATKRWLATVPDNGGIIQVPGLDVVHDGRMITSFVLTTDDWVILDGITVGMTTSDVVATEATLDELGGVFGDTMDDPYRLCVIDLEVGKDGTVTKITTFHAPMSITWLPEPPMPAPE